MYARVQVCLGENAAELNLQKKKLRQSLLDRSVATRKEEQERGSIGKGRRDWRFRIDSKLLEAQRGIASQRGERSRRNLATGDLDRRHVD